jgi:hypothetical protein
LASVGLTDGEDFGVVCEGAEGLDKRICMEMERGVEGFVEE